MMVAFRRVGTVLFLQPFVPLGLVSPVLLLSQYSPYFKFGFSVKYGLIQLSEDPALFHRCFDKRFENGGLS